MLTRYVLIFVSDLHAPG